MSTMAPGSEPARRPPVARMTEMLHEQAGHLARAGADLIVLEMMRDVDYATGAVDAARATGLPVWVGFSCRRAADGTVRMFSGFGDPLLLADVVGPVMARGGSVLAVMHSGSETPGRLSRSRGGTGRDRSPRIPRAATSRCRAGDSST
jgi:hypothetical protein